MSVDKCFRCGEFFGASMNYHPSCRIICIPFKTKFLPSKALQSDLSNLPVSGQSSKLNVKYDVRENTE